MRTFLASTAEIPTGGLGPSSHPVRDNFAILVSTVGSQALSAVFFIVVATQSSLPDFGKLVTEVALATVLVALLDFGTNAMWFINLSQGALSYGDWQTQATKKIFIGAAFVIPAGVACIWLGPLPLEVYAIYIFLLLHQSLLVPLKVLDKNIAVSISTLLDRLVVVVGALVLGCLNIDLGSWAWALLASGTFASSVYSVLQLRLRAPRTSWLYSSNPWRGAKHYGFVSLLSASRLGDVLLISLVAGTVASAEYGAVIKWIQPIFIFGSSFSVITTPLFAQTPTLKHLRLVAGKNLWAPIVGILAAIVLTLGARPFVTQLLGVKYQSAAMILVVVALGSIGWMLSAPLISWLQVLGSEGYVTSAILAGVGIQALIVIAQFPFGGGFGAGVGFLVGQSTCAVMLGLRFWRVFKKKNR